MNSTFPLLPILLVDDEENFLLTATMLLSSEGISNTKQCADSRNVMPMLSEETFSVILLDMNMPYVTGWELLPQIVEEYPSIPVVIITAINEVETAVECMKTGAFDYLVKPLDESRLITTLKRAIEMHEMRKENTLLREYLLSDRLDHPEAFEHIVTQSEKMKPIFQYIEAIAKNQMPVLITGETGVGKELIAESIHDLSERSGEFVPVNVAGVDDTLFSDTLFGHKRGAFTGADRDRKGLIEEATGGTLFLDEIGDLSLESQVKLLRLLQEGKYYPIGSDTPKLSNARVIVATNRNITDMQKTDKFRKDLYYRLRTHHINIPPLRERKEDIPLLTEHFLKKFPKTLGKKMPTPPKELATLLCTYSFPGNIRELEGMVFDAVSRHRSGVLSMDSFKEKMGFDENESNIVNNSNMDACTDKTLIFLEQIPTLKEAEQMLINEALKRANGNQTITAQLLGLSRRALNNRLSRADSK